MKNVAQPATLSLLESRLRGLTPQSDRRWGTLTPEEMLCHLASLAAAPAEQLNPVHYMVGPMSRKDWRRWAYKHADHHLRQFGL